MVIAVAVSAVVVGITAPSEFRSVRIAITIRVGAAIHVGGPRPCDQRTK